MRERKRRRKEDLYIEWQTFIGQPQAREVKNETGGRMHLQMKRGKIKDVTNNNEKRRGRERGKDCVDSSSPSCSHLFTGSYTAGRATRSPNRFCKRLCHAGLMSTQFAQASAMKVPNRNSDQNCSSQRSQLKDYVNGIASWKIASNLML